MLLCPICEQQFPTLSEVTSHVTLFHEDTDRSFACKQPLCLNTNRNFYSWTGFRRHLETSHRNEGRHFANEGGPHAGYGQAQPEPEPHPELEPIPDEPIVDNPIILEVRLNLDNFISNFYNDINVYVASLYGCPNLSRKSVEFIMDKTCNLFAPSITLLKENVFHLLTKCEPQDDTFPELCDKVHSMLEVLKDPFQEMNTDYKRLIELEKSGDLVKPESFEMGHEDHFINVDGESELVREPVFGQFIPLRRVLKPFLQIPGMFSSITNFVNDLTNNETDIITHFMQGALWKELCAHDNGKLVLPLHLHFDDYEPDNALGSHHGSHSLGALYVSLACLPSHLQFSTESLFLLSLFESQHRKQFGNLISFAYAIQELSFLEMEGITIVIANEERRVFFRLGLILGDNLGYHAIAGFMESFRANFFCRFCKLHRDAISFHCDKIPEDLMRSVASYDNDVALNTPCETGIKEECVWNALPSYHCIKNCNVDIMHDYYEGVLKYDLCKILHNLITIRGYFDLETLMERVDGFNYGSTEQGNKPPTFNFSMDSISNCSLNLSAAENLCLFRYLGEMIGDLVPIDAAAWRLYRILHEILCIVTSPVFDPTMGGYLDILVSEHHSLYIVLFGALKPKHHFMLHYSYILMRNGPVVLLSALPSERKHRYGKIYAKVCNSRVNFPLSVALKFQLSLCHMLKKTNVVRLPLKLVGSKHQSLISLSESDNFVAFFDDPFAHVSVCRSVDYSGTVYSVGMVIVLNTSELFPLFGRIKHIIINLDQSLSFVVNIFNCTSFNEHCRVFIVEPTDQYFVQRQTDLLFFCPLLCRSIEGKLTVALRHGL